MGGGGGDARASTTRSGARGPRGCARSRGSSATGSARSSRAEHGEGDAAATATPARHATGRRRRTCAGATVATAQGANRTSWRTRASRRPVAEARARSSASARAQSYSTSEVTARLPLLLREGVLVRHGERDRFASHTAYHYRATCEVRRYFDASTTTTCALRHRPGPAGRHWQKPSSETRERSERARTPAMMLERSTRRGGRRRAQRAEQTVLGAMTSMTVSCRPHPLRPAARRGLGVQPGLPAHADVPRTTSWRLHVMSGVFERAGEACCRHGEKLGVPWTSCPDGRRTLDELPVHADMGTSAPTPGDARVALGAELRRPATARRPGRDRGHPQSDRERAAGTRAAPERPSREQRRRRPAPPTGGPPTSDSRAAGGARADARARGGDDGGDETPARTSTARAAGGVRPSRRRVRAGRGARARRTTAHRAHALRVRIWTGDGSGERCRASFTRDAWCRGSGRVVVTASSKGNSEWLTLRSVQAGGGAGGGGERLALGALAAERRDPLGDLGVGEREVAGGDVAAVLGLQRRLLGAADLLRLRAARVEAARLRRVGRATARRRPAPGASSARASRGSATGTADISAPV